MRDGTGELIAEYDYDAAGYRVRSVVNGVETYYFRDAAGQVLSEFKNSTPGHLDLPEEEGMPLWDKDYIYALGQAVSLVKNELPSRPAAPWVEA